jgi:two-component system response regulator AlgR
MKVLIVDDEPLARQRLAQMVAAQADCEVLGTAQGGDEALLKISQLQPDVVLLDIRMPGIDGLETARRVRQGERSPVLIFCTAYDEHALSAFDVEAVDYLVKPVRPERLRQALDRAARQLGASAGNTREPHLQTRIRGEIRLIPLREVHYLLADAKYVEVHTGQQVALIEDSLVSLEERFPKHFLRVHRNCLVAVAQLAGLRRTAGVVCVALRSGVELEVSRRNLAQLRRVLREA